MSIVNRYPHVVNQYAKDADTAIKNITNAINTLSNYIAQYETDIQDDNIEAVKQMVANGIKQLKECSNKLSLTNSRLSTETIALINATDAIDVVTIHTEMTDDAIRHCMIDADNFSNFVNHYASQKINDAYAVSDKVNEFISKLTQYINSLEQQKQQLLQSQKSCDESEQDAISQKVAQIEKKINTLNNYIRASKRFCYALEACSGEYENTKNDARNICDSIRNISSTSLDTVKQINQAVNNQ